MSAIITDDETPTDRVQRLLNEAQDAIEGTDDPDSATLRELAAEANDLVASTDTRTLVEAAGVDVEDDAPKSIPAAIARGDSESVVDLRFLLALSRLADREGDAASAVEDDLQELAARRVEGESADETGETESAADAEEAEEKEGDGGETDAEEAGAEEGDAEEASESDDRLERLQSQLQSRFGDGLDEFRAEIQSAREKLSDESEDDEAEDDEEAETEESETDETSDRRPSSGRRGGVFSTVPSSNRADMRTPRRHSTVRSSSRK